MKQSDFDCRKVEKWEAPSESGVKVLTMPNIPYPLHACAPRTLLGRSNWDKMRHECYDRAGYRCEICGSDGLMHAHELYNINWAKQRATFVRCVCLCKKCHLQCIHTGRALTMYKKGSPLMTHNMMIEGAEHAFKLIHEYNSTHRSSEPLRLFSAWLDYIKQPALEETMRNLIRRYEVSFYRVDDKWYDEKHWGNWKLIINGVEYPTPYKNRKEWEEAMEKNNKTRAAENSNPFTGGVFDEIDKMLQEEW